MVTIDDLAKDWRRMQGTLKAQLALLESGKMRTGDRISDSTTIQTIERIKCWLAELDALLAEHRAERRSE